MNDLETIQHNNRVAVIRRAADRTRELGVVPTKYSILEDVLESQDDRSVWEATVDAVLAGIE